MTTTDQRTAVRKQGLGKGIVDIVSIVLVVMAAKTAIAEPFYVPSAARPWPRTR